MTMPIVTLKPREEIRIRRGHPWIYDNEIASVAGGPAPGDEVRAQDSRGRLLGYGFFNPVSKIRVRIFSHTSERADGEFFACGGISRPAVGGGRLFSPPHTLFFGAFGGAPDSAPGLIVDLFRGEPAAPGCWLSTQFLSLGVARRKDTIVAALQAVLAPDGIAERSDAPVLAREGIPASQGILAGTVPETIFMRENGATFAVDIAGGQKTGWFLDQRANRAAAARYARGREVLDIFCNQGGFGILCAKAGAAAVTAVDSSADALAAASRNAALNGVADRYATAEANAFDYLRELERSGRKFGLVVLDPPAFAKSRSAVEPAYRGYKEVNVRAMRLTERGGILVTCSCSHWFDAARFDAMIADAAFDCGRRYRIVEERSQDLDHPIVSGYDESRYLKCRIIELD